MIDLNLIRTDGGTQSRTKLDEAVVSEYADAYMADASFPPVIVFYDGKDRWLADGFHRYFGAKKAGKTTIYENIIPGTRRDAILYSLGANGTHGLNRTNADKRSAVETMLQDTEWATWSNVAIAKACFVSEALVRSLRLNEVTPPTERTYTTKQGTRATMQTANIGKPQIHDISHDLNEKSLPILGENIKSAPVITLEAQEECTYTPLDAANERIEDLQVALAMASMGNIPESEKTMAKDLIDILRAEVKTLTASLDAVSQSRDSLMQEVAQLKKQCQMQRKEIEKLKTSK